jgi:cell division protein FtsB
VWEARLPKLPRLTVTRVALLLASVAVGYTLFSAVSDALLSRELNRDEGALKGEITTLDRQQQELEAIRDYLTTSDYIEGVARRVLGLVRPGETLVVVSPGTAATPTPAAEEGPGEAASRPWWERLYKP